MIRAVVYLAEWHQDEKSYAKMHPGEAPPTAPPELNEWWDFVKYGLPPLAGGMRDQPYGWMDRSQTLDRIYRAWYAYNAGDKSAKWKQEHPTENKISKMIKDEFYG